MENSNKDSNKLYVPGAIVLAGALIAVAVYMSNTGTGPAPTAPANQAAAVAGATSGKIEARAVTADDHILGNPNSPLAIIVFTDIECPFCKSFHKTMQNLMESYGKDGKLSWVYRHFPLEQLHPKAPKEAEAFECANELGGVAAFWKYADKIFEITPSNNGLDEALLPKTAKDLGLNEESFKACLESGKFETRVRKDYDEAVAAGGRGTPFSIFSLKTAITDEQEKDILEITKQFPAGTFVFSENKKMISMSGALPLVIVEQIIKTVTGSK